MSSTSLSSTTPYHHRTVMLIPFLLFLLSIPSTQSTISEHHNTMLHVGRRQNSCHPISAHLPPPLGFHLQRLHRCPPLLPPPPPPLDDGDEIDPRYGVEKRLVPSGPNPLHN